MLRFKLLIIRYRMHSEVQRGQAGVPWSDLRSFDAVRASALEFARKYWGRE
jgi:hypothetical protein